MELPNRKNPRASWWDYTNCASYFITICTKEKAACRDAPQSAFCICLGDCRQRAYNLHSRYLRREITCGVAVADVFHHLPQKRHVARCFAFFHPLPDEVAEDAAEVFVAGVGEEAAAVGEHADEYG